MSPEKRMQILNIIAAKEGGATVYDIAVAIGVGDSGIARYIAELRKVGDVVQVGEERRAGKIGGQKAPVYKVGNGVPVEPEPDIFEQCRTNWAGYIIHKVFGAGGAVRIEDGHMVTF